MAKINDIRVDEDGVHHCWNCLGTNFTLKRTRASKVLVGVGTYATKKKKHCQDCGCYNKLGNAKHINMRASEPSVSESQRLMDEALDTMNQHRTAE